MSWLTPAQEASVLKHLQNGQKIQAIKAYREYTGTGLKEAKEAVEKMLENPSFQQQGGDNPSPEIPVVRIDIQGPANSRPARISGIHMLMLILLGLALLAFWQYGMK